MSSLKREISGIALLLFAVFLAGALAMHGLAEWKGAATGDVRGNFGWMGLWLARPLAAFFGWPAAALIPLAPAAHALRMFDRLGPKADRSWMVFLFGLVILLPV